MTVKRGRLSLPTTCQLFIEMQKKMQAWGGVVRHQQLWLYRGIGSGTVNICHMKQKNSVPKTRYEPEQPFLTVLVIANRCATGPYNSIIHRKRGATKKC